MRTPFRSDRAPDDASPTATRGPACTALVDHVAALLAGQLQMAADLASLRYEIARLGGATRADAVDTALDGLRGHRHLQRLNLEGFDPHAFEREVRRALEEAATREGRVTR